MSEIRELAIRLAMESGFMLSTAYGQHEPKLMPVSDAATIEKLIRAAMREGMMRAAEVCKARATIPQEDIQSYMESGNSGDIASAASDSESHGCANAIRAEADKLEGK